MGSIEASAFLVGKCRGDLDETWHVSTQLEADFAERTPPCQHL